jgi:hypothetical protein
MELGEPLRHPLYDQSPNVPRHIEWPLRSVDAAAVLLSEFLCTFLSKAVAAALSSVGLDWLPASSKLHWRGRRDVVARTVGASAQFILRGDIGGIPIPGTCTRGCSAPRIWMIAWSSAAEAL